MTDMTAPRRLAELYRAAHAQAPAVDAEALLSALDGGGEREQRDDIFSRAAANPLQADLLRTLMALRQDSETLAADVRSLRRPRLHSRRPAWSALAASVALAAVVAFGLRGGVDTLHIDEAAVAGSIDDADRISSVSFEATDAPAGDSTPLFSGGFDS
jgi:hypothetical protein